MSSDTTTDISIPADHVGLVLLGDGDFGNTCRHDQRKRSHPRQLSWCVLGVVCAVDPEVIKMRTTTPSETTQSREEYRIRLLKRDIFCVWTGVGERFTHYPL